MTPPNLTFVEAGDMRDDPADILVCCVCTVPGVMGAGQAKAFVDRWPWLRPLHVSGVRYGLIWPGRGRVVWQDEGPGAAGHTFDGIYLLPTKDDWKDPSRLEWVASGLDGLVEDLIDPWRVRSVALPALGCGLGGLPWDQVRPLIESAARRVPAVEWRAYLPGAERRAAK